MSALSQHKTLILKLATAASLLTMSACTRIETGEVGVRVGFDKQVQMEEIRSGAFPQTIIGSVYTFPIRDIAVMINDKQPMSADNSQLKDFDMSVIYSIDPTQAAEIYSTKSRSFHGYDETGSRDIFLMYNYVETVANNAMYKEVRKFDALKIADNRQQIEAGILAAVQAVLKPEGIDVSMVQVRNAQPNDEIVASANAVVRAQNDLKTKEIEVNTAKAEAERIAALNSNAKAIEYMNAQAQMKIAEGIAGGKVNTIVVPFDFKGMINIGK